MSLRLRSDSPLFNKFIDGLMADRTLNNQHVDKTVTKMEEVISKYSDKALMAYNKRLDNITSKLLRIKVVHDIRGIDLRTLFDAKLIYDKALIYHSSQLVGDKFYVDKDGIILSSIRKPLSSVGIYISGEKATYISSMFMNAVPARLAGVKHIYVVTSYNKIKNKRLFMACASICGVEYIYNLSGAQAIIALALGTKIVRKVDKITGSGNIYVTCAKKKMFGRVEIDDLTGPLESIIIADDTSNEQRVSADLASQLEHNESALAILITKCPKKASAIRANINSLVNSSFSSNNIKHNWSNYGLTIICKDSMSLYNIVKRISPEHLYINILDAFKMMKWINSTGIIFLGKHSPIAIGGYISSCNHALTTGLSSGFTSTISVLNSTTKTSAIYLPTPESLKTIGKPCMELVVIENMKIHALSISCRLHGS
ncbi:Histidinol dehydrogenase [Candidatus Hodgkinia cicadicola]|uniref:Histidinol dehydrogenase n=1 Tax=Candidatus Hodgkinia cicadicola TaxID=573658 RepID=A0ABX4MHK0_9HYPH|nr:Histidinol dehydrogenase [Candidatus Hodgkinia cicadicola]